MMIKDGYLLEIQQQAGESTFVVDNLPSHWKCGIYKYWLVRQC